MDIAKEEETIIVTYGSNEEDNSRKKDEFWEHPMGPVEDRINLNQWDVLFQVKI